MTTPSSSDAELLTEHFGYAPVSLIDDIINSVNTLAERALSSVEKGLLDAPASRLGFKPPKSQTRARSQSQDGTDPLSPDERRKNEVENGTHQLETLLCASIDRNFDKLEIYLLRNIFTVRPPELRDWIRLSHYEGLDFSRRDGADAGNLPRDTPTVESITALRRRLRESMRLNALLTAERARNEALLEDLRRLVGDPASTNPQVKTESASPAQGRSARNRADAATNTNTAGNPGQSGSGDGVDAPKRGETGGPFAFLHQKGDLASSGGGAAPLETTAAFTLSQMQALRALSTALSNVMPDLKTSSTAETVLEEDDHGSGTRLPRSWRRERAEYVESATRRHLETVQGLELGKHGEVRDGEWQGPGRNLAAGEVEGLEQVVAMLGGGNGVDSTAAGPSSLGPTEQGDEERMDES